MSKHTPGPWKVSDYTRQDTQERCIVVGTDYPPGKLCDGSRSIATMTGSYYTAPGEFHKPDVALVNTANARLIAAAPDLLEAARMMRSICHKSTRADVDRACNALDAAIARAEGK